MYLLDTNIVSADAPAKRKVGPEAFAAWVREHGDQLYISSVTIAEIEAGIARAERIGATTKAKRLRRWLAAVEHFYAGRILPFGIEEARPRRCHSRSRPRTRSRLRGHRHCRHGRRPRPHGSYGERPSFRPARRAARQSAEAIARRPVRTLSRHYPSQMAFTATVASTAATPSMPCARGVKDLGATDAAEITERSSRTASSSARCAAPRPSTPSGDRSSLEPRRYRAGWSVSSWIVCTFGWRCLAARSMACATNPYGGSLELCAPIGWLEFVEGAVGQGLRGELAGVLQERVQVVPGASAYLPYLTAFPH